MLEKELGERRHTVSIALRGQTRNGGTVDIDDRGAYTVDKYLTDFDNTLKKFNRDQIDLCGYSHYGYFTTLFALKRPQNVASLILIEPALFNDPEDLFRRAELAMAGEGIESIELMLDHVSPGLAPDAKKTIAEGIKRDYQSNTAIAGEFLVRAHNPIMEADLASLDVPVLLIGGTESHARSTISRAAALIPNACVWWIKGATHLSLMSGEHSKLTSSVIDLFVKQSTAST